MWIVKKSAEHPFSDPTLAAKRRNGGGHIEATTGVQRGFAKLQTQAGNSAVVQMMAEHEHEERSGPGAGVHAMSVERQVSIQREDGGGGDSGGAGSAGSDSSQPEMVRIETDQGDQCLPKARALTFLQNKIDFTTNKINLMQGENEQLKKQRDDSVLNSVFGSISDVMGGFLQMPDPGIWDEAYHAATAAAAAVASGDPKAAGDALKHANDLYQDCRKTYLTWKEGNFEGADNTITVLKAVIAIDAAAAAALTGGASLGAASALVGGEAAATVGASSVLTEAAVTGAVGMETAAISDWGSQAASDKPFNWAELAEKTGAGFASGFLGACISGPLKQMLSESCSGYVTEELMSGAELKEIEETVGHEVERDFLQSDLKRFIIDKATDKIGDLLAGKPIDAVVDKMTESSKEGGNPLSAQEAVDTAAKAVTPQVADAYKQDLKNRTPAPH